MTLVKLKYLAADVLGLAPALQRVLATRPTPATHPGMIVPGKLEQVPRREDHLLPELREEMATELERNLARFEPHVHVIDAVRALGQPGACAVVAGQQPGFLGGPLYNAYKALHAIRLACALGDAWDVPVLPVFWNHADDHDIAEVHHHWIQNRNLDLHRVRLAGVSSGRTLLSQVRFDEERSRIQAIRELLQQNLPPSEYREGAIEQFLPRAGETFSGSFSRLMLELFGEHGLIVVEPDWIRSPLSRALSHVVTCDVAQSLAEGSAALEAAGSSAAIEPEQAALLFRHVEGQRHALRIAPGGFHYDGEEGSRTPSELAAEILQEPDAWSAGALLRPIVQDMALPVVAYVGGWGELGYHAQLPPLRERAGVPRTAFVPRLSATWIDRSTATSLERLGLDLEGALRTRGELGNRASDEPEDDPAAAALRAAAQQAADLLGEARAQVDAVDRGLAKQIKKLVGNLKDQADKIAHKVNRVQANAQGGLDRHRRRLDNMLFPRGLPQERVHGSLGLVARHGRDWIGPLLREIDPLPSEHLVITLEDEGDST